MKKHIKKYMEIYKYEVLLPSRDRQLVIEMDRWAKVAGIPKKFIYRSIFDFTESPVIDWMRSFKGNIRNNIFGVCVTDNQNILVNMSAVVGCGVRNYIDSRLMTVQEVITNLKNNIVIPFELVAVPNFYVSATEGGSIPAWQSALLLSWLYDRYAQEKQTAIYVSSLTAMENEYGKAFSKFISENYIIIGK